MKNKLIVGSLFLLIVCSLVIGVQPKKPLPLKPDLPPPAKIEKYKPNFFAKLPQKDINDEPIVYDKKYYLLDVWSITCPPCRMTVPELVALQDVYKKKNFMVVGLSLDGSIPPVKDFMKSMNVNYPVALITDEHLALFPPIRGIPTMFLVDANGKIIKMYIGYTSKAQFRKELDGILK